MIYYCYTTIFHQDHLFRSNGYNRAHTRTRGHVVGLHNDRFAPYILALRIETFCAISSGKISIDHIQIAVRRYARVICAVGGNGVYSGRKDVSVLVKTGNLEIRGIINHKRVGGDVIPHFLLHHSGEIDIIAADLHLLGAYSARLCIRVLR